jgi:hypothetical protein
VWYFHLYMYYNQNWFIHLYFFPFNLISLLMVISTGLRTVYSFLYIKYTYHFSPS